MYWTGVETTTQSNTPHTATANSGHLLILVWRRRATVNGGHCPCRCALAPATWLGDRAAWPRRGAGAQSLPLPLCGASMTG